MIKRDAALAIARAYLLNMKSTVNPGDLVILEDQIREASFGWVLPWNSRRYIETKDPLFAIYGNHPLVVLHRDGSVMSLPIVGRRQGSKISIQQFHGSIEERIAMLAARLDAGA